MSNFSFRFSGAKKMLNFFYKYCSDQPKKLHKMKFKKWKKKSKKNNYEF